MTGIWPSEWRPGPDVQRRVVCAAIMLRGGRVIAGPRHMDAVMRSQLHGEDTGSALQGFVDQFCAFLTREEAWPIAVAAGQILRRVGGDEGHLYSENLY